MFFPLLLCLALGLFLCLTAHVAGDGDAALAALQETIAETGKSIKSVGDRLEKLSTGFDDQDIKTKALDEQYKKISGDLAAVQKSLNEHIESVRTSLKNLPVHSGGHDTPPQPWNTKADGSGFQWSDAQACKAFGLYLMARCSHEESVRNMARKALDKAQNRRWFGDAHEALEAHKAMSAGDFAAGGATVPEAFLADIIRNVESYGTFAANARRIPMPAPTVTMPKSLTELTVYYPEENANTTESNPTFGDITLNARLYATLSKWSNTLSEDSAIDFGSFMADLIAYAQSKAVDDNGYKGDGTSTYARVVGILNAPDVVTHILGNATGASATNTGKDTFGEIAYNDLCAAQGLLPTKARAGAKWYCHRYVASILNALVDTSGRPIFQHDYVNGKRVTKILGDPLVETSSLPYTTAVTTPFMLYGDMRLAMGYGERRSLQIANSQEAGFAADQTWVRSTARRAIVALDSSQMVVLKTSTT